MATVFSGDAVKMRADRAKVEAQSQRAIDNSLAELARDIGQMVLKSARKVGGVLMIPDTRVVRDGLKSRLWEQVIKPYYIGAGDQPLIGIQPQSEYTRLIVEYIRQGVAVQADYTLALLKRYASPIAYNWLVEHRPTVSEIRTDGVNPDYYDPFHLFVYRDSPYRLSDRIWETSRKTRDAIDGILDYHIAQHTSAMDMADLFDQYLNPSEQMNRTMLPYRPNSKGQYPAWAREGSYSSRRLARTEITASAGRAFINASIANPFVNRVRWSRSGGGQPCAVCDSRVGVYQLEELFPYPGHPFCKCYLTAVVDRTFTPTASQFIESNILQGGGYSQEIEGMFYAPTLADRLVDGAFVAQLRRLLNMIN